MFFRALSAVVGLAIAATLLMWPGFFNHQPFFFPDTTAYVRGADAAVVKLTGIPSAWTKQLPDTSDGVVPDKAVLAGRSIYYGALVYLGDRGGGGWLTIVSQAALVVLALWGTLRAFRLDRWPFLLVLVIVLAAFTALPLYASFLMPDVFTGLTILVCAILLSCDPGRRAGAGLWAWVALLAASLTFHTSHALIAVIMGGTGFLVFLWRQPLVMPRGLIAIAAAVGVAFLCGTAFTVGVSHLMGEPPLTPPFLMARLIDDGPGTNYLRDTCPASGFLACRFVDRLPLASDDFLWSKNLKTGVFGASAPSVRRALSREQYRFALAVVSHEPLAQSAASFKNAAEQLVLIKATEFGYTPEDKGTFAKKLPAAYFQTMQATPAYTGHMPISILSALSYASTVIGLAFIAYLFATRRYQRIQQAQSLQALTAWVLFGVVANAAVCGVMSGPHDRYEARVAWLIPAMALIAHFLMYRTWWERMLPGRPR